jgi:hypothetical protein
MNEQKKQDEIKYLKMEIYGLNQQLKLIDKQPLFIGLTVSIDNIFTYKQIPLFEFTHNHIIDLVKLDINQHLVSLQERLLRLL